MKYAGIFCEMWLAWRDGTFFGHLGGGEDCAPLCFLPLKNTFCWRQGSHLQNLRFQNWQLHVGTCTSSLEDLVAVLQGESFVLSI